jgi:hypothetical protein
MSAIDVAALFACAPLLARKSASYRLRDGSSLTIDYDPAAPCIVCGLPVVWASMGGTAVCSWCDCGEPRPS